MKKDRLPPGQELREDFPVLHYGHVPSFNEKRWDFRVTGLIKNSLQWTFDEFKALPAVEITTDFHCVTGWSKFNIKWKGVLFKTLSPIVMPFESVRFVSIIAEFGYTANMPLDAAMDEDVIFAYECDGKPLTPEHGYPLRLVVPKRYAYKSAKWVRGIEFLDADKPGFWEIRGYSNSADPWKEERFEG
ncbi:MAG: sulfite oxidase-like oxidoreductase [Nitrospirae bacterium]|nr:sulfite oxidase-like oxidoreductase [Nitrospirota bacterium]